MAYKSAKGGFIKLILIIIIAVLVLSYFGFDIKSFIEKPETQQNLAYTVSLGKNIWDKYLSKPLIYFWNNIFVGLLWSAFLENFNLIKEGKPPVNFQATDENTSAKIDELIEDIKTLEPKPIEGQ